MILKNKSPIKSIGNAETHGSPKTQPAHFTSEKTQLLPAQVIPLENDFSELDEFWDRTKNMSPIFPVP